MKIKNLSAILGVCLASGSVAFAADPSTTTFGSQPNDTFASTSIDNTKVESTVITDAGNSIQLDLTSTQRGSSAPPVSNVGNTFTAQAGHTVQFGLNLPLWTFDYAITVNNNAFSNYTYLLIYGNGTSTASFNPTKAVVTDDSNLVLAPGVTSQQNDENLGFATGLAGGFPALPTGFNPDANGVYTFTLEALSGGNVIGSDAITVDVVGAPDAASTLPLLGLGFAGLAALRRRFNRA